MNFKVWLENDVKSVLQKFVRPGTIVYRGLKIGPESRKQTLRQLLKNDYFKRNRLFDHWSLEFKVASNFSEKGVHLNPNGTSGDISQTVRVIIAAKINPEDVDQEEFFHILTGKNYTHLNGGSYFKTDGSGRGEQEMPVLRSSYDHLPLIKYWIYDKGWKEGEKTAALT